MLNSTATPCIKLVSKRECEGQDGTIYTQLWSGYAAQLLKNLFAQDARKANNTGVGGEQDFGFALSEKVTKSVVVIDLGSGEFKRWVVCQCRTTLDVCQCRTTLDVCQCRTALDVCLLTTAGSRRRRCSLTSV